MWNATPGGEVRGRVTDGNGEPIVRAQASLRRGRGRGTETVRAETDTTGAFTLRGVSAGKWNASVLHLGHAPFRSRIEVRPGSDTVRVRLAAEEVCMSA